MDRRGRFWSGWLIASLVIGLALSGNPSAVKAQGTSAGARGELVGIITKVAPLGKEGREVSVQSGVDSVSALVVSAERTAILMPIKPDEIKQGADIAVVYVEEEGESRALTVTTGRIMPNLAQLPINPFHPPSGKEAQAILQGEMQKALPPNLPQAAGDVPDALPEEDESVPPEAPQAEGAAPPESEDEKAPPLKTAQEGWDEGALSAPEGAPDEKVEEEKGFPDPKGVKGKVREVSLSERGMTVVIENTEGKQVPVLLGELAPTIHRSITPKELARGDLLRAKYTEEQGQRMADVAWKRTPGS